MREKERMAKEEERENRENYMNESDLRELCTREKEKERKKREKKEERRGSENIRREVGPFPIQNLVQQRQLVPQKEEDAVSPILHPLLVKGNFLFFISFSPFSMSSSRDSAMTPFLISLLRSTIL